jgi:hypothetical protein
MLQHLLSIILSEYRSAKRNAGDLDTNCKLNFQSSNSNTARIRTGRDNRRARATLYGYPINVARYNEILAGL